MSTLEEYTLEACRPRRPQAGILLPRHGCHSPSWEPRWAQQSPQEIQGTILPPPLDKKEISEAAKLDPEMKMLYKAVTKGWTRYICAN